MRGLRGLRFSWPVSISGRSCTALGAAQEVGSEVVAICFFWRGTCNFNCSHGLPASSRWTAVRVAFGVLAPDVARWLQYGPLNIERSFVVNIESVQPLQG